VLDHIPVIEVVDEPIAAGKDLMPVLHEIIADAALLGGERRQLLGPLAHVVCRQVFTARRRLLGQP
jgi:hypothetical protein